MYVHIVKGQKISEDFCLFFNPSKKKPTKMFPHFCPKTPKPQNPKTPVGKSIYQGFKVIINN